MVITITTTAAVAVTMDRTVDRDMVIIAKTTDGPALKSRVSISRSRPAARHDVLPFVCQMRQNILRQNVMPLLN